MNPYNLVPGKRKAVPGHKGIYARLTREGVTVYDAIATVSKDGISKQQHLGTRDNLGDAVALRSAHFTVLESIASGKPVQAEPEENRGFLTVEELGRAYMREVDPPRWDRNRWNARVSLAHFYKWPVSQVTPADVSKWIHTMATTRTPKGDIPTRPTVFSALVLLRRVFRWACMAHRQYMISNPADGVKIKDSTETRLKSGRNMFDYLRESEALLVINGKRRIGLEPWVKFMVLMFSGARPRGVWTLEWDRVDWSARTILFRDTKGENASGEVRMYTVHMLDQLHSALREWWLYKGKPTSGLVFPSAESGGVYDSGYDAGWQDKRERRLSTWFADGTKDGSLSARTTRPKPGERTGAEGKALRKLHGEKRTQRAELTVTRGLRAELGITRKVPLYSLRHTCACQLLLGSPTFTGGRRWSREEVQAHLGHLDAHSTEHYMRALGILAGQAVQETRDAKRRKLRLVRGDERVSE